MAGWQSIPEVCEVTVVRGARVSQQAEPVLLVEVPHGATRAAHYDQLRRQLQGDYPDDLRDFFFVNTDVGAPEVALALAGEFVAAQPGSCAVVVRCLVPRTFVDCNRVIAADATPSASAAGEVTPGLHAYVRDPRDRALLLARYAAYRQLVTAAFAAVCGQGGHGLMLHSYAPRSIDVPVDEHIVRHLRAAYAPERIGGWQLRAEVDLITRDPDGRMLASPELSAAARQRLAAAGYAVAEGNAYALHPVTLAHEFAVRHPGATLCLELRRDLLVPEFTPFAEMVPDPARVERAAAALAAAVVDARSAPR